MNDLDSLKHRVDAATGPSRELDYRIQYALFPDQQVLLNPGDVRSRREAVRGPLSEMPVDGWEDWEGVALHAGADVYTASLDAALALMEKMLPGCDFDLSRVTAYAAGVIEGGPNLSCEINYDNRQWGNTLPLAILSALFAALIAKAGESVE